VPFAAPHAFVLAVVDGPDQEITHRIARAETRIGRGADVDVALSDVEVSTHHCTVRCDAGACHVLDAGSLNGTLVNERPVREGVAHRLHHLDEIRVGSTRLLFLAGRFQDTAPR
jgi:pSer/pThr/pTyr-binding forkhead associated (FHA) protein